MLLDLAYCSLFGSVATCLSLFTPGFKGAIWGAVPPGKYFMSGDSRDNSFASRFWGFVERKQIVGKANRVLFSFDRTTTTCRGSGKRFPHSTNGLSSEEPYCDFSRKNLVPTGGFTINVLVVPLSVGRMRTLLQFTAVMPLVFCCNVNPVDGDGQETTTVFVVVRATVSDGGMEEYSTVT